MPTIQLYTDEDMSALVAILPRAKGVEVTTVPEQSALGKTDAEQLEFASAMGRCFLTHNRVDFERLHIQYTEDSRQHSGIIVIPQKKAHEIAQRVWILVNVLTANEINNQLLYA